VQRLGLPALGSGLALLLPLAAAGLRRHHRVVRVTLAAWLGAGLAGVLAGGSYWPHYLIQLVVPTAALAGTALAATRLRTRATVGALAVALAAGAGAGGLAHVADHPRHRAEAALARYVRAHARPGDTQYVIYARANLVERIGLSSPYPYEWSLLVRAMPGAPQRLARLLASPHRPTWVVGWQHPRHWGLDPHHAIRHALRHDYRRVARIHGHPVYHRTRSTT
jgi:hypothetical protein